MDTIPPVSTLSLADDAEPSTINLMASEPNKGTEANSHDSLPTSRGWIFHSLCSSGDGTATADGNSNDGNTTTYTNMVDAFHHDGFICLSSLFTPDFTSFLLEECDEIVREVFAWLVECGETEFALPSRRRCCVADCNDDMVMLDDAQGESEAAKEDTTCRQYEYPLQQGLKNGYKELVMRSPGRYELVLLVDDPEDEGEGSLVEKTQCLLSKELFDKARRKGSNQSTTKATAGGKRSKELDVSSSRRSCLELILEWIQNAVNQPTSNNQQYHLPEQCAQNQEQMQQFMMLVKSIFSPLSTQEITEIITNTSIKTARDDEFYLANFSLLISTPGSTTQSWHCDGGHTSLQTHNPCHCFNVFLPLVDVPMAMGPTEVRPGSHVHTRNLAPMLLAARARKTLRAPVIPLLRRGDALLFDYRILHRGRANGSEAVDEDGDDDLNGSERNVTFVGSGKDRPVLVMTFAKKWFVDVLNFPKRSIFQERK